MMISLVRTSEDDNISPRVIFRAVREVFGDSVTTSNKRIEKKCKKVFLNLRKGTKIPTERLNAIPRNACCHAWTI